jgi:chemotaxis protein methyltransferase CheR
VIPAPLATEVERFRALIAGHLGLHVDDSRLGSLADLLRRRSEERGEPCELYLGRMERDLAEPELALLATELTVTETYFFRNFDQFRAVTEVVLPARMRARAPTRQLRILSAGCASGEEPYSLAIAGGEAIADRAWELSILAVDANRAALDRARRGRFSSWALRETPPDLQRRWFAPAGRDYLLDERVLAAVRFEAANLADDDAVAWRAGPYDLIFCRNVVMYFAPAQARALVARLARALVPGGYLFLGHAETLRGLSNDFHLCHTHNTFYYQRRAGGIAAEAGDTPATAAPLLAAVDADLSWVESIRRASERVQALTGAIAPAPASPARGWSLDSPLELLRRERFAEALDSLRALPPESARDPEALLLQAVLLAHGGWLEEAEEVCDRLLAIDELNAGAHYVRALCREGAGPVTCAVPPSTTTRPPTSTRGSACRACTWACWPAGPAIWPAPGASSPRRCRCCSARTRRACCCSAAASAAMRCWRCAGPS